LLEELGVVTAPETVAVESSQEPDESDAPPTEEVIESAPTSSDDPAEEAPSETEVPATTPVSPTSPAPEQTTAAPSTPAAPGSSARQAEKESDATGIVDVAPEFWQNGKPLAARGLELKPRRPVFPLLTQMTAQPGNPLCVLRFRRDGRVAAAAILQASGDDRVDRAIESSLYGWRASGKALTQLEGKQTIDITIRIVLIEPRR
jgi:outer membrane biosynthesis protein TonB